jgi:signal peptidase I
VFVGVVGFIVFGLLIGGVRAVSFASRWKADHPDEDIRNEPLDGLSAMQRFFARLPLAFWPWARPLFVAYLALYALLLVVLINSTVFLRVVRIDSDGMEPGIGYGEQTIVLKAWVMGPLQRGDLALFRMPQGRSRYEITRIIGIPGDRVRLRDKQLILNGHATAEPYAEHTADYPDEYRDNFPAGIGELQGLSRMKANVHNEELVVPPGFYFVLGDNRDFSYDSRYIGLIPANDIAGRPIFISGPKRGFRAIPRIHIEK